MVILLNFTTNRACYNRYDYRIKYLNLKNTRSQNSLALEDVQRLWIPFLVFDNTEKNEATKVHKLSNFECIICTYIPIDIPLYISYAQGTEDTELTLTREGDYIVSSDDNVEEINIFEGQFNRITFEQVYTKTFKCTYQLQLYPFDTQVP